MKITVNVLMLLFVISCSVNKSVMKQENSSYKMSLVKVVDENKKNAATVILKVSPTIEDFKLIISGRAEYSFGGKSITTIIEKDPNIRIIVYGADFSTKAPALSSLLNNGFEMGLNDFLLVFKISNIEVEDLVGGYFKYGLWESNNPEIRNEQKFLFNGNKVLKN